MKFILDVTTGYRVLLGFHGQDRHFDFMNEGLDLRSVLSKVMASARLYSPSELLLSLFLMSFLVATKIYHFLSFRQK